MACRCELPPTFTAPSPRTPSVDFNRGERAGEGPTAARGERVRSPRKKRSANERCTRRRFTHEGRLTWLTIAAAPAAIVALALLWFGDHTPKVQWTLTLLIAGFGLGFILSAREHVIRPLQTMTNLLAALREGDYSIRARGARVDDALGEALLEINALGETLRLQRLGAFEATALLRTIMAEIDVAVFTFDPERRLRLVNRAGEDLLGQPMDKVLGRRARDIGLEVLFGRERGRTADTHVSGRLRKMGRAPKFFPRTRLAP